MGFKKLPSPVSYMDMSREMDGPGFVAAICYSIVSCLAELPKTLFSVVKKTYNIFHVLQDDVVSWNIIVDFQKLIV